MENAVIELTETVSLPTTFVKEKITFEDYLIQFDGQYAEWIDGEVKLSMPASDRHQDLSDFFISLMRLWVERKDAGKMRTAPLPMKLSADKRGREPDLMFIAKENLHKLKKNYLEGAADLVIEIISPESRSRDRGDKFYEYESAGVKEYWLIDYERSEARFYELNKDGIYQLANVENGIYYSKVLEGLFIKTAWLWQEELPNLMEVLEEWKLV